MNKIMDDYRRKVENLTISIAEVTSTKQALEIRRQCMKRAEQTRTLTAHDLLRMEWRKLMFGVDIASDFFTPVVNTESLQMMLDNGAKRLEVHDGCLYGWR